MFKSVLVHHIKPSPLLEGLVSRVAGLADSHNPSRYLVQYQTPSISNGLVISITNMLF